MKKILIFVANLLLCIGVSDAAVRDGATISRTRPTAKNQPTQSRVSTTVVPRTTSRTSVITPRTNKTVTSRGATQSIVSRDTATARTVKSSPARAATTTIARNATSSTRTGAEYEQCKNAYFSCMDQFCALKNDDYRRCSCNDRVFELSSLRDMLQDAGAQLTTFNENLDVVGMTAAQASAMRTESEGETALTSDNSASKALLQAIMNSIRGEDATVGGKYTDLNSINMSFDTVNAFGMTDIGQAIATYNGTALYSAVYPQCRNMVRENCNDASLQRAITAYLMAVEQDCNTVQTAIETTQSQMKSAVRESNALLDLARIENRQKHNSSDIPTCIKEIETAILSEQVCGANYHKCLDNGEYVDITTGKPIAGVEDFFKLGTMLTFNDGVDAAYQKLAQNPDNRKFVQNFENRTKQFAADALDKCVENADIAWSTYLDQAMLSIYYAQQAKVSEVKQTCFDYISSCYKNTDDAINDALSGLNKDSAVVLQPDKIALSSQVCRDYINSCNNMFDGNIIEDYIAAIEEEDTVTACRAIAQQCFDKYGGTNYENFYYPNSGLFTPGYAADWFTLYEYDESGNQIQGYKSECAKQLASVDACKDKEILERAFGGFDRYNNTIRLDIQATYPLYCQKDDKATSESTTTYGIPQEIDSDDIDINNTEHGAECQQSGEDTSKKILLVNNREMRSTGIATEVYNNIISILHTQCTNINGSFVPQNFLYDTMYDMDDPCHVSGVITKHIEESQDSSRAHPMGFGSGGSNNIINVTQGTLLATLYEFTYNENMCPVNYKSNVDTKSWGACSCWANGARRSKNGTSTQCLAGDNPMLSTKNQVCPDGFEVNDSGYCVGTATHETLCNTVVGSTWTNPCSIPMTETICTANSGTWENNTCNKQMSEQICTNNGGTWTNTPCTLSMDDQTACTANGGTWNSTNNRCDITMDSDICKANGGTWGACTLSMDNENACRRNGGTWENNTCNKQMTETICTNNQGTWKDKICYLQTTNQDICEGKDGTWTDICTIEHTTACTNNGGEWENNTCTVVLDYLPYGN